MKIDVPFPSDLSSSSPPQRLEPCPAKFFLLIFVCLFFI